MQISEGMSVADLGAGTGYFLGYLSSAVGAAGKVTGLDVEADMVRYMNERAKKEGWANTTAQQVPMDGPGLGAGSVDRILIVDTWHHIPNRGAYAAKLREALKDGGAVYIVDFKMDSPHGPPKAHRLQPGKVIAELQTGGLQAELVSVDLPYQWVVRGSK
jgi:ubiquinone/menaquinone biosynthesis C-methylase UbiE